MKIFLRILFLAFFPLTLLVSQAPNFQKVNTYSYPSFNEIRFINENTGWVVGVSGSIYKTTDAGQNWFEQRSNSTVSLSSLFFLDDQKGFVGGANCSFLRTSNGGTTWEVDSITSIPTGTASIGSVYFSDNLNGWILASTSAAGWILSTKDGGTTWTVNLTTTKTMNKFSFFDANKGVACGKDAATLYYTSDGINWNLAPTPALGGFGYSRSDLRGICMTSATDAYVVGWGSAAAGLQPSIFLKTVDGGATWIYQTQTESNRTYDNLWDVRFKDINNGIAIGGAIRGSIVVRTSDAGVNWIPVRAPLGSTLSGISILGNKVWVAGSDGLIAYSPDFGDSWQLLTPMPSGSLSGLVFPTSLVGYAGGFKGILLKTTDGGQKWSSNYLTVGLTTLNIQSLFFLNENIGYAACSYEMAAKTTDGGANWTEIIPHTYSAKSANYGVHFISENLGFIVGKINDIDAIYKTTDGGLTWNIKSNVAGNDLRDVTFKDENNGIIVGFGLKALYTSDGGENWNVSTFNNLPVGFGTPNFYSVKFISENEAVAVGVNFILKSSNSGVSWNYVQTSSANQLNSVAFKDQNIGYAVGVKEAWKTTDGGTTWGDIYDTAVFDGTLYSSVVDPDGNAWFGGASSSIFTNRVWVGVEDEQTAKVNDFDLKQNYPNPFNPSTIINYKLAKNSFVKLDVYDVLGKQVEKLVNEQQSAGNYDLNFAANKLSAGVYFYTLKVDGKVKSKKMILIK